jgi:uncharacterized protein
MVESTLATVFLLGLLSGVHCAGMCGGIVAALSMQSTASGRTHTLHIAYNAGRIASYGITGASVGALGSMSLLLDDVFPAQLALRVFANLLLIALGLYLLGFPQWLAPLERTGARLWRRIQPFMRRLLPADTLPRAFFAGMVWGWLPCAMVYSVLGFALAAGSALRGASVMLAFGLGTLPHLLAVGFAVQRLGGLRARRRMRLTAGVLVVVLGLIGFLTAQHASHAPDTPALLRTPW